MIVSYEKENKKLYEKHYIMNRMSELNILEKATWQRHLSRHFRKLSEISHRESKVSSVELDSMKRCLDGIIVILF
jgi:hypothetical protein